MKNTLEESGGIGLAAPQVGVNVRIILVQERVYFNSDTSGIRMEMGEYRIKTHVMINPEIVWASEEKYTQVEGCLSFPEVTTRINRHKSVRVKWIDFEGNKEKLFSGLESAIVQHETEHLDGVLISDKIGPLKSKLPPNILRRTANFPRQE